MDFRSLWMFASALKIVTIQALNPIGKRGGNASCCDQQVVELKKMPLDAVTQIVKPAEDRRQALEQIQSVALNGAETLATTCPKKLPEGLTERLAILRPYSRGNGGFARGIAPDVHDLLRPA